MKTNYKQLQELLEKEKHISPWWFNVIAGCVEKQRAILFVVELKSWFYIMTLCDVRNETF